MEIFIVSILIVVNHNQTKLTKYENITVLRNERRIIKG